MNTGILTQTSSLMIYEVEQKYPVSSFSEFERAVNGLGGQFGKPETQVDRYFNHPSRDFAESDEALRIRSVGEANCVTYKGPKIDATTKTRREIETAIAGGATAAGQFAETFIALGFRETAAVHKERRTAQLERGGFEIEITLDDVQDVGQFVEIEIAVAEENVEAAKSELEKLASELNLGAAERRSYLELLLAVSDQQASDS